MSVVFQIFLACAAIQCLYYIVVFARLNWVRPFNGVSDFLPPASVIICSQNDADNLAQNLKVVLIQQYKQYEVIVVNDQSTDHTADVLVEYYKRNPNLKIVNIPSGEQKPLAGKKYALLRGIEIATFDTIVVTDADCRPATTYWLAKVVGAYLSDTKIVLAHSPFERQPGFLNKLIRYENFMTSLQYFGFAKIGMPYMGTGRNLSYKKELFGTFKGFGRTKDVPSGDDSLLVNATATAKNTEICIDKDAFTYTKPKNTFGEWFEQKRRHLGAGLYFRLHHIFLLFLFPFSNLLFYGTFVSLLVSGILIPVVCGVFSGVLLIKLISVFRVYKKLGSGDLWILSPVLDVVYLGYLLLIFFLLLLKPKKSWN